jgi:hypothetical protein
MKKIFLLALVFIFAATVTGMALADAPGTKKKHYGLPKHVKHKNVKPGVSTIKS